LLKIGILAKDNQRMKSEAPGNELVRHASNGNEDTLDWETCYLSRLFNCAGHNFPYVWDNQQQSDR